MLDTWNAVYYPVPFLLALLAWEVRGPQTRPPVLALSTTALVWISFEWLPLHASPDVQSAFFVAWSLPLVAALGLRLRAPERPALGARPARGGSAPAQGMTVSALGRLVRSS